MKGGERKNPNCYYLGFGRLSPLSRAEGTVSADRWRALAAADGALDGREEELTFVVPKPSGPAFLSVRVVDASGNSAAVSAEYPGEFR